MINVMFRVSFFALTLTIFDGKFSVFSVVFEVKRFLMVSVSQFECGFADEFVLSLNFLLLEVSLVVYKILFDRHLPFIGHCSFLVQLHISRSRMVFS